MHAHASEALQNGCVASRLLALGYPGCEHLFKVIRDLPMPFHAMLPNAAVICRLGQKENSRSQAGAPPNLKTTNFVSDNCEVDQ
jgi:hypothetical protein